ncbi:MAG: histidine kinase [Bacteroidetes bacterium]|nr:histidine kinase [Bacteroidota bacterium]
MEPAKLYSKRYKFVWQVLSHPMNLSLIATILVVLVFPSSFPKYKAVITDQRKNPIREVIFWDDLENDGTSDKIFTYDNNVGTAALTVNLCPSGGTVEWDLRGKFSFNRDEYVFTGDYDNNRRKEIYVFTLSHDTIYLHAVADFKNPKPWIRNRFISTVGLVDGKSDPEIMSAQMDDLNGDGYKELIFGITTGFSVFPRNVYAYDIVHDTLIRSPRSGFQLQQLLQEDITGDSKNEILAGGYSAGNTRKTYPYSDSSSWLMVFDRSLNFLFKPVEFPGVHGSLYPLEPPATGNITGFSLVWRPPSNLRMHNRFYSFDGSGKGSPGPEMIEVTPDNESGEPFVIQTRDGKYIVVPGTDLNLYLYDTKFRFVKKISAGLWLSKTTVMDIDGDGRDEILATSYGLNKFGIFRSDLSDPVILDIELSHAKNTRISQKLVMGSPTVIVVNSGEMQYGISCYRNPLYYLKWIIYSGIYLCILLFTLLVRKIQKIQLQKRFRTEKKITELQLKIVRNQMDPHFTMNAIDSVISAVNRNEKEKATDNLYHFSKLYRSLVLSADKISRPLREELEFTENYLALEKFRFTDRFDYLIVVDPSVDKEWDIPKMLIQSPVENAVKHGLSGKEKGGMLKVSVTTEDHILILKIEDNGIGRKAAGKAGNLSTGKGLQIMDQFLDLYHKITGVKVHSEITDLFSDDGNPSGTKVIIRLPVKARPI